MLIIDEVHAMLAGSFRQQRIFLNANDLKAPLVCAGTDLARQSLLTDPQLAERFEALQLRRWADDRFLTQLLSSLGALLPLRRPSALETTAVRKRVLELTDGVTVRIFRLIETVAAEAIRSGAECITKESFEAEGLVLPLVAMTRKTEERLLRRAAG
jgi:Bacterial TniB protein